MALKGIIQDAIITDEQGVHFYPSGTLFDPTSSADAIPAHIAITCSSTANQLIYTSELNPYLVLPLMSSSDTSDGAESSNYFRYYSTSSHHFDLNNERIPAASASIFSSASEANITRTHYYNINIQPGESAATVRQRTYDSITGSFKSGTFFSASLSSSYIFINYLVSGALTPTIYTSSIDDDSFNFNYIKEGSGTFNFISPRTIPAASSSFSLRKDPNDTLSTQLIIGSSSFGGSSDRIGYYMSSSGNVGVGTTDPKSAVDFKADGFKIRSADGKREIKFEEDGRLTAKKFADTSTSESVGSTIQLSYTPGTFETPLVARVGETIGTINWVDESFNEEAEINPEAEVDTDKYLITGSIAQITSTVRNVTSAGAGGDLEFKVNSTPGEPTQALVSFLTIDPSTYHGVYFPYGLITPTATKVTLGYISQSGGTAVDNTFDSDIILDNNVDIQGKKLDGTARNLIFMGTNDIVQVGATAETLGLRSSGRIQITGSLYGAGSDIAEIRNITASGAISASGIITGLTGSFDYISLEGISLDGGSF
jgi:hypothetical protein